MATGLATCPTCGKNFNVDSSMVGQSVRCPWCGEEVYMEGIDAPIETQVPVGILHDSVPKGLRSGAEAQNTSPSYRPVPPRKTVADDILEPRHAPLQTGEVVFRWLFALAVLICVYLVYRSAAKARQANLAETNEPITPTEVQPAPPNVNVEFDGKKADVELDSRETEAEKRLRECLVAFRNSRSYDSFSMLFSQLCDTESANDELVRESVEEILKWAGLPGDRDLPEEKSIRQISTSAKFRDLLAKMQKDEQWKRLGFDTYASMLREKIIRHEEKLAEDMECFKTAVEFVDLSGQKPSVARVERLQQVLVPISRTGAYADVTRQTDKYISMVHEASKVLSGDISPENLVVLPASALTECEQCHGSGEKICPDCNNTRICKLCDGKGVRFVEGFESTRKWNGKRQPDSDGRRQIPCDKVCSTCKSIASRKCPTCKGNGRHADAVVLKEELRSQAEITKDAMEKVVKALTSVTKRESPEHQ